MAAPHIAGLAALIKQKFPSFSPAAIASALSTTASLYDNNGGPIMAQRAYSNPDINQSPATPFDMGSGFVNATAALDPGLIFDSGKLFHLYHTNSFTSYLVIFTCAHLPRMLELLYLVHTNLIMVPMLPSHCRKYLST